MLGAWLRRAGNDIRRCAHFAALAVAVGDVGVVPGRLFGLKLGPFMKTWWLVLMSRSRRDSATTGLGNSGYQS